MNLHLYQNFADSFDNAFGLGITSSIDNGLAATTGPMTTLLIIYVIVTGWLIMRGDMAARPGIFRIVRAGAVVMALSATYFNPYIRDLFLTAIPAWAANAMTPGVLVNSVPQQLDLVRSATLHLSAVIYQNTSLEALDSRTLAGLADICVTFALGAAVLIYSIAHAFTGLALCVFPFVAAGYLFDATKPIVEGWIGKMVSLSILTLLVTIMANIVVKADSAFIRNVANNIGTTDIREQVSDLWGLAVFYTLCTVIMGGLPGLAYSIGRGIAINTSLGGVWDAPARALDRIRIPTRSNA